MNQNQKNLWLQRLNKEYEEVVETISLKTEEKSIYIQDILRTIDLLRNREEEP